MSTFNIVAPKLGESVLEVTITKWFVKLNDIVEEDDLLFEVASDKVDSEIPSPVAGKIIKINHKVDDVVPVGETIAVISLEENVDDMPDVVEEVVKLDETTTLEDKKEDAEEKIEEKAEDVKKEVKVQQQSERFYSPLVKSIAKKENISFEELEKIDGSGKNGRVQKQDVLSYLKNRDTQIPISVGGKDQIIEMDRMRKLIADHMVMSKKVSPHVFSVVEADVTKIVNWRNKVKDEFLNREGVKLTYTHLFVEATIKAIRDFPLINSSVDGYKIIVKNDINIGIAVALQTGNLIVPVIKNAEQKSLVGLVKGINDLAERARNSKLTADEIQGGTFTITNFGSFRNLIGAPIINQPQVAILATGSIERKPAVVMTSEGEVILPRSKMYLSLSYDHRVVDGMLGGMFLRKIADYLEEFDVDRKI